MAPQVRFVSGPRSRIACAVDGIGPPLILPAWWVSHVRRDFAGPAFSRFFTTLATRFTVVRYDRPGVGLSDRERTSFTLEDEVATLLAVIDELALPRVSLLAISCGAPPAMALAERNPERVERLMIFGGYASGSAIAPPEVRAALLGLVRASWGIGAKALSDIFTPEVSAEEARGYAAEQRHAASADTAARLLQLTFEMDVQDLIGRIQAPTLVLHRREDVAIGYTHGREVAARIPGATLALLDGRSHLPWQGDPEPVLGAIAGFCGQAFEMPPATIGPPATVPAAPTAAEFRRDGDVWTVSFAGQTVHLKHARGLTDLATLLASPGRRFHASELMGGPTGEPAPRSGADPMLDERARTAFRTRLAELDEQLEQAQAMELPERVARLEGEREAILEELRAATGLGGRRRALGDSGERARKAVTGRIRESIARLHQLHPAAARHLDATVTTGIYCVYTAPAGWGT
jgi:pimeloyl-ACP methyl ester carboxylesterase